MKIYYTMSEVIFNRLKYLFRLDENVQITSMYSIIVDLEMFDAIGECTSDFMASNDRPRG